MDDKRTVRHVLEVARPGTHTLRVTTTVGGLEGKDDLTLALPVWAPGSYKVRDFSKGFLDLQAREKESGRALVAEKTRKNSWRIRLAGARTVEVVSQVYGFELTVRTNHIDDRHAFVN